MNESDKIIDTLTGRFGIISEIVNIEGKSFYWLKLDSKWFDITRDFVLRGVHGFELVGNKYNFKVSI